MRFFMRLASGLLGLSMVLSMPALANDISGSTWSETDSSNNSASPNGWTSGVMLPSQVEPTARGMMGATKRFYNHINGTVTSGGSANAQTLTYSVAPAAYVTGDIYTFKVGAGLTNTGGTTLAINTLGAVAVQSLGANLTGGELTAGRYVSVVYDGTKFQLLNSFGGDQFSGLFGSSQILAGTSAGINSIVGQTVNNLAASTSAFPAGVTGAGQVSTSGNTAFGMFAYGICNQASGGAVCIGGETTVSNRTANNPDVNLPPNAAIGTTTTVVEGWNVTCGTTHSETKDCSIGVTISNDAANPASPSFNTALYIPIYRSFGLYIDAMPSGSQVGALIKSNGNMPAMKLLGTVDANPIGLISGLTKGIRFGTNSTTSIIEGVDTTGVASFQPLTIGGSTLTFTASGVAKGSMSGAGLFDMVAYSAGGVAGITKTCSVMPTQMTITGGIITSVTGGTCS